MAIKFEKIQAGMTLYDRHRHGMGNTTMTDLGEWQVRVLRVVGEERKALVSWNGNAEVWWPAHRLSQLYSWSMYDPGVEVKRGLLGRIISVKRIKAKKEVQP